MHFINYWGEELIFWQCRGEGFATLLHSDLGWVPEYVGPEMLRFHSVESQPGLGEFAVLGDTILNDAEVLWIAACFTATAWAVSLLLIVNTLPFGRRWRITTSSGGSSGALRPSPVWSFGCAAVMHASQRPESDFATEIRELESSKKVVREAMAASEETWSEMSFEAKRLVLAYLIDQVSIGARTDPIDQQIQIVWRATP